MIKRRNKQQMEQLALGIVSLIHMKSVTSHKEITELTGYDRRSLRTYVRLAIKLKFITKKAYKIWVTKNNILRGRRVNKNFTATYEQVKRWNIENDIRGKKDYREKRPAHFPKRPEFYKRFKKQWSGWNNFKAHRLTFEQARKLVRSLNITSKKHFNSLKAKNDPRLKLIPYTPEVVYK